MKQFSCEIISCLRRMICCSCHTPTITYIMKKAQMTSRKGPTTPLEGVWWGLWGLSIAWSPMLLSFWWVSVDDECAKPAEKGGERWSSSKMRYTAHKKKVNWRIDEYKSESTSPTAQNILKLGRSNKGIWRSMQQKFQTLMIYISPKF